MVLHKQKDKHEFYLCTTHYELQEQPDGVSLRVEYIMTDDTDEPGIWGSQDLRLSLLAATDRAESIN